MRVVQVINAIAPTRGGPSYVVAHLSRALAALGVDVEVVSTRADLDEPSETEVRKLLGDVPLHLTPVTGPARLELAPGLASLLWRKLAGADLAHVHTVFTYPVAMAPLLCRARGVPFVVRPAGTLDRACLDLGPRRQKRLATATYVRANLLAAAAVHATSAPERDELRRLAPRANVLLAEIGAEVSERFVPDAGGVGRRIGFLGRLHPKKQLEALLGALALLPQSVALAVAGSGEPGYLAELQALARRLGVDARVEWLGHLGADAKRQFLDGVDVVACPSLDENFGVVVVEAMSAGRAVVASSGVALAAAIAAEDAGVVAPTDPPSLARAIADLLDDGAKRARIAAAGRALAADRWSWKAAAERTLALYDQALSAR